MISANCEFQGRARDVDTDILVTTLQRLLFEQAHTTYLAWVRMGYKGELVLAALAFLLHPSIQCPSH